MLKYLAAGKLLQRTSARVDNTMFLLHYRATFIFLMVASALITAKEYFGTPIVCYALKSAVPQNVLNTYCFIMSTYSVTKHNTTGIRVVYPGVGPHDGDDEVVYRSYYQWVPLMLFMQAITFYIPRFVWKSLEGGLFSSILQGLDKMSLDEGTKNKKHMYLIKYMLSHLNMHRNWAIRFFMCESLCLLIVVGNIYLTDLFLGGTFMSYGTDVLKLPQMNAEDRRDPMDHIFPRVTMCTFRKFGTSGNIENHESMCVLPVNILNVKIYIAMWYWLVSLSAFTGLWILCRLVVISSTHIRAFLLNFRGRLAGQAVVKSISKKVSLGDWFLLYHLGSCMHAIDFAAFLREFSRTMNNGNLPGKPPFDTSTDKKPMLAG